MSAHGRTLRRHFHGKAYDEKLDSAGRIRLPKHLVEHAGLKGTCVVIGMEDYFEVWDPERWAKEDAEVAEKVGAAAEELAESE